MKGSNPDSNPFETLILKGVCTHSICELLGAL